ncbi:universal stress protein [Mycolicibacterium sp. J2]|uniref:universal stress protein n=1 Tax=Mycolicibacterium sp. J2 TaxID=2993511 RepID=UPI00224B7522|nr:universal stress protein [Mycolicibacterium sp. J2]MCX2715618.1 universal stress protein [Mycolicibacterium sp. J2]
MSTTVTKPIIVGIDGSAQAENAAHWAVGEAQRQNTALRLVYVIRTDLTGTLSADEYRQKVDDAKEALESALRVIDQHEVGVVVQSSIADGSPSGVLLAESSDAAMICVGSSGMGRVARSVLGSTAATLAERAACPVGIIRRDENSLTDEPQPWIIVPVDSRTDDDSAVIAAAAAEARYRNWPVLAVGVAPQGHAGSPEKALDELVSEWKRRFPALRIYPISAATGITQFLHANPDIGGVVVVEGVRASDIASIMDVAPHADRAELAVLVARRDVDRQPAVAVR